MKHIITKLSEGKERLIKAAREKQLVICKETLIRFISRFSIRNFADQKGVAQYIQSTKRKKKKKPANHKYTTQQSCPLELK